MNAPIISQDRAGIPEELQSCFDRQRAAALAAPYPDAAERIADLKKLAALLKDNREALVAAFNADYGNRSTFETLFVEFFLALETIHNNARNVRKWMKPQRRSIDVSIFPGAKN